MQPYCQVFDIQEIVVDTSFLDDCALGLGHEVIYERGKANAKLFCDNLAFGVNRPKICNLFAPLFFGNRAMFAELSQ